MMIKNNKKNSKSRSVVVVVTTAAIVGDLLLPLVRKSQIRSSISHIDQCPLLIC